MTQHVHGTTVEMGLANMLPQFGREKSPLHAIVMAQEWLEVLMHMELTCDKEELGAVRLLKARIADGMKKIADEHGMPGMPSPPQMYRPDLGDPEQPA